jgi:hypothetical protein
MITKKILSSISNLMYYQKKISDPIGLQLQTSWRNNCSRRLPTEVARLRVRADMWGFEVDKAALGQFLFWVRRFPLPIIIPPISPSSKLSEAGTVGLVTSMPSWPDLIPPPTIPIKKPILCFDWCDSCRVEGVTGKGSFQRVKGMTNNKIKRQVSC